MPEDIRTKPLPNWRRIVTLVGVLLALGGLYAASRLLPVGAYLGRAMEWIDRLGAWGYVVFIAIYVLACVLMVPGSVLTLGAGFVFGLARGTAAVSVASTVGACLAFVLGRTLARGWIAGRVADRPRFRAIDEAVGREGFKIVLLTRLSPVFPFNLLNYAYGLTRVSFWSYAAASWIGMLPGTVMYVYFGGAIRSIAELSEGDSPETGAAGKVFFWAGLAIAIAVAIFVGRVARRSMAGAAPGCIDGSEPECADQENQHEEGPGESEESE
ncbi:MAG: TVP38/TMEM64 family protein [Planctomycetota bacterium]|jgi:uncharacterized membrane protein YdjX (TVP38/TMEM64 family)